MNKIAVIVGSTRPTRFGIKVAQWFMEGAQANSIPGITFELIDLAEHDLPLLKEPESPATGIYKYETTKNWSALINAMDGFVIIHPEYNHGISAALKNALDHLWKEWNYKPLALVGYGMEAGGARAAEHLRGVAAQMKMFDLREQIILTNYPAQLDEKGNFIPTEGNNRARQNVIKEIAFWTERLKPIREARQQSG